MKTYTKFALTAVSVAVVAGASVVAEDFQMVRIDHGKAVTFMTRNTEMQKAPTIGVFADRQGLGGETIMKTRDGAQLKKHDSGRQTHYFLAPEK